MSLVLLLLLGASVLAWVWLLTMRGGFWRADRRLGTPPEPARWPEVVALIPARDEAEQIGSALTSHGNSRYPGRLSLIVIDDNSTDRTGEIARDTGARIGADGRVSVHVVAADPLPRGWSGKLWALEAGRAAAERVTPDAPWVLLCDADIRLDTETLGRLVAKGEAERLGLVSLMARLDDSGRWGGLLIPAFVFFFQKLYPFAWVAGTQKTAAAAGGCVLVRRAVLERIGWPAAIKGALIDDCALAARVKGVPGVEPIWLGLAEDEAISLRDNSELGSVWRMVKRSAFAQLDRDFGLLALTVLGMGLLYLAGPLAVLSLPLHGSWLHALLGAIAWGLMTLAYAPTLRLYDRAPWEGLLLPVAGLFYTAMTVDSAIAHESGKGGAWKGRTYP